MTAKTALMFKTACKTWIPPPRARSSIVGSCILATVFLGTLALLCSIYSGVTHSDPNGFSLSALSSSLPHSLIMKALQDTEAAVQEPRNFEDCHSSTILGFSHAAGCCLGLQLSCTDCVYAVGFCLECQTGSGDNSGNSPALSVCYYLGFHF